MNIQEEKTRSRIIREAMKEFGLTEEILNNLDSEEKIKEQRRLINKRYHKLALLYHPDRDTPDAVRFQEIVVNLGIVHALLDKYKLIDERINPEKSIEMNKKQVRVLFEAIEWKKEMQTMMTSHNSDSNNDNAGEHDVTVDVQPQENQDTNMLSAQNH